MGTCCAVSKKSNFSKYIGKKLTEAIEANNLDRIREVIIKYTISTSSKEPILNINTPIVKVYSQDMNALGYCLFLGYTSAFAIVLELGKAKLSAMSKLLLPFSKRPIDIICELGHKPLLEFYLPFHLNRSDNIEDSDEESISLSFTRSKHMKSYEKGKVPLTGLIPAVHRACEKGKLDLVEYLYEYFKNKNTPEDFDVHHEDEITGENCALVSCKTGMIEVIKFLYEKCDADFHILNKRKESALQILAIWSKKTKHKGFVECFKYLIEVVGVDFRYEAEETLLVLEDKEIIFYFENKLKSDGWSLSKSRIDDKYSLSKNRVPPSLDPMLEFKLSRVKGNKFNFGELFKEELKDSEPEISYINPDQSLQSISQITIFEGNL